jgi:hypothetical protein
MGVNNFREIPLSVGMDYEGHTKYISYISAFWRVPLANEGWQMFQPPLFYFLEAVGMHFFSLFFNPETVVRILKLLPFLCGAAQVEICYRTLRYAYPERHSLQTMGTLLGGLLPMNIYISQSLGNEPLAGFFTALIVMYTCKFVSDPVSSPGKSALLMGLLLGLALLTKVTAILIVPPVLFFISVAVFQRSGNTIEGVRRSIRFAAILLAMALAVSGWYYLRNWIEMGRFFVGGWDASREIIWWQDPGYRTFQQFYTLKEAFIYPVYSSIHGFWDAIYSSLWMDGFLSCYNRAPWNYSFMLSSAWLSILPTTALIIGCMRTVARRQDGQRLILRFAVSSLFIYFAAIFYIFLKVPIFSSAKATYALGLTPCFALLAAAGFDLMLRKRFVRAVVYGLFTCWAVAAYAAYFVI